jgi:hypothetical protein
MPIDPSKIPPWMQQLNGMQLSPEQMAQLNNQFAGTYGTLNRDGFDFAPAVEYGQGESGAGNNTIHGYSAIPQGTTWDLQDGEDFYGGFDKSGKFEGARQPHAFDMGDATPFLFALAAGAAAMAPAAGAAAGAGGTGAGTGAAVAGDAFLPGALGAGYEGATLTGLDAYLAGGAGGAAGGASSAAGAGGGAGNGFAFNAAVDSQAANAALGLGPVSGATAPAVVSGAGGGGGGSLLSGMGAKDLLGIATTVGGAISGAKGQESEQTSTRDIPEWLKPYATKVLGYGSNLLDAQMTPEAQQGYTDMRTRGQSLLNAPMMGNGFANREQFGSNLLDRFYPQASGQSAGAMGVSQPASQGFSPASPFFNASMAAQQGGQGLSAGQQPMPSGNPLFGGFGREGQAPYNGPNVAATPDQLRIMGGSMNGGGQSQGPQGTSALSQLLGGWGSRPSRQLQPGDYGYGAGIDGSGRLS